MEQLLTTTEKGTLSTVLLPIIGMTAGGDYETCWFPEGDISDVLDRYSTPEAARAGHERHARELGLTEGE